MTLPFVAAARMMAHPIASNMPAKRINHHKRKSAKAGLIYRVR
jgi:hypothetical protein